MNDKQGWKMKKGKTKNKKQKTKNKKQQKTKNKKNSIRFLGDGKI